MNQPIRGVALTQNQRRAAIEGVLALTAAEQGESTRIDFGGVVVGGDRRGRLLGFPTANVDVAAGGEIPDDGVYACWVSFPPAAEVFGATVSIGFNPTFDDVTDRRVEAFVHDLDANLYGSQITVRIVGLLREMVRFDSLEELIVNTADDVERSRALLSSAVEAGRVGVQVDQGSEGEAAAATGR